MELFDTTMVGLERAMSGAQMRQQVLANNLANANTPGFKRSDVDFHSALAAAFGQGAATPAQIAQARFDVSTDSATSTSYFKGEGALWVKVVANGGGMTQGTAAGRGGAPPSSIQVSR